MTTKPFLARYAVEQTQEECSTTTTYNPNAMLLFINGQPAVLDPNFADAGTTLATQTKRETTDDQ